MPQEIDWREAKQSTMRVRWKMSEQGGFERKLEQGKGEMRKDGIRKKRGRRAEGRK
jgi:hypothetical protein